MKLSYLCGWRPMLAMNFKQVIQRLIDGNARFVSGAVETKLQDGTRRASLVADQQPYAVILSCSDSRVVPEFAFDVGLGDLFVVRVAGNIPNRSSIGSIEFAIAHLDPKVIVVLGHQHCGAVTAAVKNDDIEHNLNHLLAHITPAIVASRDDASVNDVVKKHAQLTAHALKNNSTIIDQAVESGDVKILSAYYHLDSGRVEFL